MPPPEGHLAEFYLPTREWPPIFTQGDVLENVPRVQIARVANLPSGGTPDSPVVGRANYCRTRAIIISPTCNIRPDALVQVASVGPLPQLGQRKRRALVANLLRGRNHRQFLLRQRPTLPEQIVHLTDVWSVALEHLHGLRRIICLSDWARSLLSDALHRAFARPIEDPTFSPEDQGDFRPGL